MYYRNGLLLSVMSVGEKEARNNQCKHNVATVQLLTCLGVQIQFYFKTIRVLEANSLCCGGDYRVGSNQLGFAKLLPSR